MIQYGNKTKLNWFDFKYDSLKLYLIIISPLNYFIFYSTMMRSVEKNPNKLTVLLLCHISRVAYTNTMVIKVMHILTYTFSLYYPHLVFKESTSPSY